MKKNGMMAQLWQQHMYINAEEEEKKNTQLRTELKRKERVHFKKRRR